MNTFLYEKCTNNIIFLPCYEIWTKSLDRYNYVLQNYTIRYVSYKNPFRMFVLKHQPFSFPFLFVTL